VGFKEKEFGMLIGLSFLMKILIELEIENLIIYEEKINFHLLFDDYYDI